MNYIKNILLVILLLSFTFSFSQDDDDKKLSFGVTAGFNYNSNGEYVTEGTLIEISKQFESKKKTGYHAGIYINYNMTGMYFRPEVLYTKTKSTYDDTDFSQTKLELPLMIGFDIVKPLSIFVGPSFQYLLENDFEGFDVKSIDIQSDLGVSFQAGLAIQLHSQIKVDIRYEKGISNNILTIKNDTNGVIGSLDTKPEQIILSLSLSL